MIDIHDFYLWIMFFFKYLDRDVYSMFFGSTVYSMFVSAKWTKKNICIFVYVKRMAEGGSWMQINKKKFLKTQPNCFPWSRSIFYYIGKYSTFFGDIVHQTSAEKYRLQWASTLMQKKKRITWINDHILFCIHARALPINVVL